MSLKGSCLCEGVQIVIRDFAAVAANGMGVCHCTDCRKATGGIAAFLLFGERDNFIITGETKEFAHAADSGNIMYRRYCVTCGSPVGGDTKANRDEEQWVFAGLFPPQDLPPPGQELYGRNFEKWYKPFESAKQFDGMPE